MSQQPTTPMLCQDIALACVDPWGRTVKVPTTFGYRADDPYGVSLTFRSSSGDVEWIVARTLLLQGLATPAGEGDVKVYPSPDVDGASAVTLEFSSPDGRLVAQADSHALQAFLVRTFAAVPMGAESEHLDLDALIAHLLGEVA